jgi:hypothetical protein
MKLTKRKCHKSSKKTRKQRFRLVLKGGSMDDEFENPPEFNLEEYFCGKNSYMGIKSDLTKVIHKFPEIRKGCILISQKLQSFIFEQWTPMLEYIFSQFEIIDQLLNADNLKIIFNKIKLIVNENTTMDRTTLLYYEEFTKHLNSQGITPQDISTISQAFYRFYLKGGSAMLFIIEQYQTFMKGEKLSPEEIENLLGGYSDFDFNFIINPYLPREGKNPIHHNKIRELTKTYIFEILQTLVYSEIGNMFRNDELVEEIAEDLREHFPKIEIDTEHRPLNIGIYPDPSGKLTNGKISKIKIRNDPMENLFAEIQMTNLDIEHAFRMKESYRDNKFDLIRLFASFKNITKVECEKYQHFISGELIDVSIPHFDSHEILDKWKETSSILSINNIFVYNLSSIIHDLEQVIKENIERKDTTKLEKRQKRLKFFNDFACILPQMVNSEIKDVCLPLFNEIIENEHSFLTEENKSDLTKKLVGIYINFPEFIRAEKRTIFLLLKQYFKHTLDYTYTTTTTLYELKTPFNKHYKFPDLEYDNAIGYKPSFYTLFTLNSDNSIQSVFNLQQDVYNYAIHLIEDIERVYMSYPPLQTKIKEALSALLIEFNNIYISIGDNTIKYETILQFIQSLNHLLIDLQLYTINDNYAEYLTGLNIFAYKQALHDKQLEKNKYTQKFMKEHSNVLLKHSLLLTKELEKRNIKSKMMLKGGFLYDIYNAIQKAILKDDNTFEITTNDMDMFMFINQPNLSQEDIQFIYQSFQNLIPYFEQSLNQRICMTLNERHDGHVIQMIVYDYVPYDSFSSDVFTNILTSKSVSNVYRIIESHTYELYIWNIYNHIEPNYYGWAKPRYRLNDFVPIVSPHMKTIKPIEKWEKFIGHLTNILNTQTYYPTPVDIRELYVDSLLDVKKSYDEILTSGKDVLKKEKYLNRMLGYSQNVE